MLSVLITISILHWVVLVTPGVNFLLLGQLAASGTRSSALAAALGITTVTLAWAVLAILGIGMVFQAHPALRQICQIAGGVYLCYVAWKIWRSKAAMLATQELQLGKWAAFRLGFMTNALNPKTALFFGSVFATALPAQPSLQIVLSAVLLVYLNALAWHVFLALAFSHARVQALYGRFQIQLNKIAASLVGAFGIKLIFATLQEMRAR